jgi:lactoylglutathione lyase/glyoxylase I family protein
VNNENKNNVEEVDIFDLAAAGHDDHIETETNAYVFDRSLLQSLRQTQAPPPAADIADFDPAPPKPAAAPAKGGFDSDAPDEPDDDFPEPKDGLLSRLSKAAGALFGGKPGDPDLDLDSGDFEPPHKDPPPAAPGIDSGVFELRAAPETPPPDTPAPGIDSGVFELQTAPETPPPDTPTPGIDSGVFELQTAPETPPPDTPTPGIDSGVFELQTAPETPPPTPGIDSGVFELRTASAGSDEWEIEWEPEKDEDALFEAKTPVPEPPQAALREPVSGPPVFNKIAHVCVYVENLERSVEYYTKIGFRKRFAFNRGGKLFGIYLEFGEGNFVELFEDASRGPGAARGRLAHFCLETPDINAAMLSLEERGIEFSPKKLGCDSTYQIWLKDPDGNDFEIHQYTPNSSQIVGGDVEADW